MYFHSACTSTEQYAKYVKCVKHVKHEACYLLLGAIVFLQDSNKGAYVLLVPSSISQKIVWVSACHWNTYNKNRVIEVTRSMN